MKLSTILSILFISIISLHDASACDADSTESFIVPGLFYPKKEVTCDYAKKYPKYRCEYPKFQSMCPTTCCGLHDSTGCKDAPNARFYVKIRGNAEPDRKSCKWVNRRGRSKRCTRFKIVQEMCPETCNMCYEPLTDQDDLPGIVGEYCSAEKDGDPIPSSITDKYGHMEDWDVSQVTNFADMFVDSSCNRDISNWVVYSGTIFRDMLAGSENFNQDISGWDVTNGEDFSHMFNWATSFNQDLSAWNVTSGTQFDYMFNYALSFNQNLCAWWPPLGSSQVSMWEICRLAPLCDVCE